MCNNDKYSSLLLLTEPLINRSNINTLESLTFKKWPILVIEYSLTF